MCNTFYTKLIRKRNAIFFIPSFINLIFTFKQIIYLTRNFRYIFCCSYIVLDKSYTLFDKLNASYYVS